MDLAAAYSGIAQKVSAAFGGPYVAGKVIDQTEQTFDDGGSIADPGVVSERDCSVQVDKATWEMQQADGYAEGDMLFLMLCSSLSGALDTDARIRVLAGPHAATWLVSGIAKDALGIYWSGTGRLA
jgi:alanyl-tRNA synthetase